MMYPILAMVIAERGIKQYEIGKHIQYSEGHTSRLLNGDTEMDEGTKDKIYHLLSPDYITKDQLFAKRGSRTVAGVLFALRKMEQQNGGKQDDNNDWRCEPGMEMVYSEPGQSGAV